MVTNQSAKSHSLAMTPITGITQTTTGAGICSNPFTLPSKGSSCTLSLQVNGSQLTHPITDGPIVCEQGSTLQCYKPSPSNILNINVGINDTTLSASVSTIGLSVNNPSLNAALVGTPRIINIYNIGTTPANNVACPTSGSASISSIVCTGCGTILAGQSCQVTITPSNTPSATPGDTSPTPITLSISGTNTNTLTPTVNVLTYGSVYQGGYIYAVDDTTPDTGSIGGAVVTQTNQAPINPNGVVWSSNGTNSTSVSNDIIPGIAQTSTTGSSVPTYTAAQTAFNTTYSNESSFPFPSSFSSCDGQTNGACNSTNILTLYNTYVTNYGIGSAPYALSAGPTTTSFYAAGRCTGTISDYSDWYLPAICEMGPASNGSGCSAGTQNIVSQLPDLLGNTSSGADPNTSCTYGANCLTGFYWSSTEYAGSPADLVWYQNFGSGNSSYQIDGYKLNPFAVRCSRALTP